VAYITVTTAEPHNAASRLRGALGLRELHPLVNPELTSEAVTPANVLRSSTSNASRRPEERVDGDLAKDRRSGLTLDTRSWRNHNPAS
jgi:hypothetical protein